MVAEKSVYVHMGRSGYEAIPIPLEVVQAFPLMKASEVTAVTNVFGTVIAIERRDQHCWNSKKTALSTIPL